MKDPSNDLSSRLASGKFNDGSYVTTGKNGGLATGLLDQASGGRLFKGSSSYPAFQSSNGLNNLPYKGSSKSSKAKLAAAGLLGVPLVAAGAYAMGRHRGPYEYGRVIGSYDGDNYYYGNSYGSDLFNLPSEPSEDTVNSGQQLSPPESPSSLSPSPPSSSSSIPSSVASSNSVGPGLLGRRENQTEQSTNDQVNQGAKGSQSNESPSATDAKSAVTVDEESSNSRIVIESGESHDLFGPARRGQKEEVQGDRATNPNVLQLSNREYALFSYPKEYDRIASGKSTFGDVYFVAIVAGVGIASIFGVIGTGYCLYRINQHAKATADIEYPAYGVVGPITKDPPSTHSAYSSGNVSPTGDRKLAQTAQMYHYHHQKAAMMASASASRSSSAVPGKRLTSTSEGDSEEEADEIDYIVYECPGLAPTGEMEVKNPLFQDDSAPASPAKGPLSLTGGKSPETSTTATKGAKGESKKYTVNDSDNEEDLKWRWWSTCTHFLSATQWSFDLLTEAKWCFQPKQHTIPLTIQMDHWLIMTILTDCLNVHMSLASYCEVKN